MTSKKAIRIGLIGCGGLGRQHARNMKIIPNLELVALCDASAESAQALASELGTNPSVYACHKTMFAEEKLDAVAIVTPNFTHAELTIDAAAAGVHVFCEKPMALTLAQCDAMIEATKRAGVLLMIGYVRRYQASFRELKRLVAAGELGDIRLTHAIRFGMGPGGGVGGWQLKKETYGGLFSLYSHELDQLAWLAGDVRAVQATMRCGDDPANTVEEGIFIGLEFESGAVGSLASSRVHRIGSYELGITGTKGTAKLTSGSAAGPILLHKHGEQLVQIPTDSNNGLHDEMVAFVESIRTGTPPEADSHAGRHVVAIAMAAHESAVTGTRVEVQ
jgi:predicted dehydrogenase